MIRRYCRAAVALSAILAGGNLLNAAEMTYAERLGWPAGTRAVIFHVDDAGMSHDSNMGAIQAVENGVASSMSIMMPCSWAPEIIDYVRRHPETDAGVHLTMNSEWKKYRWGPVAGASAVPGLVDKGGYLRSSVLDTSTHATADEVETEMRAQIDKALALGLNVSHIDSHMGTCFLPLYVDRYIKVAIEKKIPVLIFGGHMQHIGAEAGPLKPVVRALAASVWGSGLPVIDDLVTRPTQGPGYEQRREQLFRLLTEMKPGITEIIVHCTDPTKVFEHISGSGKTRQAELKLMVDPQVRKFIKDEGIVVTNWRDLMERRRLLGD